MRLPLKTDEKQTSAQNKCSPGFISRKLLSTLYVAIFGSSALQPRPLSAEHVRCDEQQIVLNHPFVIRFQSITVLGNQSSGTQMTDEACTTLLDN